MHIRGKSLLTFENFTITIGIKYSLLKRSMTMSKKKIKKIYKYECNVTGEVFKTTSEAPSPGDLSTVSAFYQMNPELDDRPVDIKLKVKNEEESAAELKAALMPE